MNKRNIFLAFGLGMAVGYVLKDQLVNQKRISPEKALENVKETFKKQGPISGSWIYMKPETIEKNGLSYTVYRGGITRNIDGKNNQYDFLADVETGAVIEATSSVS